MQRVAKFKSYSEDSEGSSLWRDAWIRLRANRLATLNLFFFIFIAILTIIGPEIITTSYEEQNLITLCQTRDQSILSELIIWVETFSHEYFMAEEFHWLSAFTAVSLIIGVAYGMSSGYLGGKTDALMMRIVDILYPYRFIFVILLMVLFGRNFILLFIAIGAVEWLTMARITRGQTLGLKRAEFIENS